MGKKIYKEYVEYNCPECLKSFGNRKDNYETHINKKKSCKKIAKNYSNIDNQQDKVVCVEIEQTNNLNKNNYDEDKENYKCKDIENNDVFPCEFCDKKFAKKFNLTRHLTTCKVKALQNLNQNSNQIPDNNKLNQIDIKLNEILKQNEELKKQNEELKKDNEKIKNQLVEKKNNSKVNINQNNNVNNINNNNNININIVNNNIVNFNEVNYNNVDKKFFVNPILDRKLFGKAIILKMIENIYINENLPEYQNVIITDKNRGYVKIYNNGKWKTDNIKIIDSVLNGIIEHSKVILDELFDIYLNNSQVKNRLCVGKKYVNLCDLEYLEELKEEQEAEEADNKNEIKRCEEFREMVLEDTINLFHDNKNILLKPKKLK